jgi:transcription initiation factor TFIIIB Brf1 subunit/transcription initiation factor TFIIB
MIPISKELEKFFKENDFDIQSFIEDPEELTESMTFAGAVLSREINEILKVVKSIDSKNNIHKVIFAAGLLEMRNQIKKIQQQNADIQKQNQRDMKEINDKFDKIGEQLKIVENFIQTSKQMIRK